MQKKIIALAVATAFSAPAFADVTPYGLVDGAIASISASGLKSDLIATSGAASQSRLGVKATEDLGDGLTGVAVLEYGIDAQTSTGLAGAAARQQMLAVAGGFGTVATGYLQTTSYDFQAKFDPIYGSGSSPLTIVNKGMLVGSGAARAQRAVAYISPSMSGLSVAVNYVTATTGAGNVGVADTSANNKSTAYLLSATYSLDALSVGAVYGGLNVGEVAAKAAVPAVPGNAGSAAVAAAAGYSVSEYALGASYDFGAAKLLGTYQSNKASTAGAKASTAYSLSGVVPVETGAVALLYGANSVGGDSTKSATAITTGYLHTLSKSTTAYIVYSSVKNGSATNVYSVSNNLVGGALSVGGSSSLVGIGLRKKF